MSKTCTHCGEPVGAAYMVIHDPNGPSGTFHVDSGCYSDASEAQRAVQIRAIGDLETIVPVEAMPKAHNSA